MSEKSNTNKLNTTLNLININFLRKEKLYTKLKYSRSPAYDIVSGGAAAIFAGGLAGISWTFYWQSCLRTWLILACFCIQPGERRVAAVSR